MISTFVEKYPLDLSVVLLQTLAFPSQGGRGYRIEMFNPTVDMDGWEVDHGRKVIRIDRTGLVSNYSSADHAEYLKHAIETEFLKTRATLLSRIGWVPGRSCWAWWRVPWGSWGSSCPSRAPPPAEQSETAFLDSFYEKIPFKTEG